MKQIEKQLIKELVDKIAPKKDEEIKEAIYKYLALMIDSKLIAINKEGLKAYEKRSLSSVGRVLP